MVLANPPGSPQKQNMFVIYVVHNVVVRCEDLLHSRSPLLALCIDVSPAFRVQTLLYSTCTRVTSSRSKGKVSTPGAFLHLINKVPGWLSGNPKWMQ